mgnify:FL=1
MKKAVILFTRVPLPGQTKTRMMPRLSPGDCARLHACFLRDIVRECQKVSARLFVCYTPENQKERLISVTGRDVSYFPQEGEGLGERMDHAIRQVLGMGYDACVLIGSDVPELQAWHLKQAFQVLHYQDVVFGATADGGYYLVGMKQPSPAIFEGKQYGTGSVLEAAVRAAGEAGLGVGFTGMVPDMDCFEDLEGYRKRMRRSRRLRKTETGRYLAKMRTISIIVPIYNEISTIEMLQDQLEPLKEKCEILLVDGGSTDGTLEKIRPWVKLLHSEKGRARQMNLGAENSHGEILFFLHCDSELPPHPLAQIRRVMQKYRAGCFGIAFHSRNFFMFTCRVISNHRIKDRKVMFGDQGIFLERSLFFEAGMFPELPIMEDYQFSLTLKEMGIRLGMTRKRIYTSDRRFPAGTVPKLRLMWKLNRLRKMYRDRIPIEQIARLYRDAR